MEIIIKKAVKYDAKGRLALLGPAGSGKTYSALKIATAMLKDTGKRIFLLDTEHESASKYADLFDFDTFAPDSFDPQVYIDAIRKTESAYGVIILDSLSHAWAGKGGLLEFVDATTLASNSKSSFSDGWRKATPKHNELVETMLACKCHLIATMRTKTEFVLEENERGKKVPVRVGMEPVQRSGLEYEFDVIADLDLDNVLKVGKTRCPDLKGKTFKEAGANFGDIFAQWLSGAESPTQVKQRLVKELVPAVFPDAKALGAVITQIPDLPPFTSETYEAIKSMVVAHAAKAAA